MLKLPKEERENIQRDMKALEQGFTEKQHLFCLSYMETFNATQSAIKAGYSERSAYSIGFENLSHIDINSYLALAKKLRMAQVHIDEGVVFTGIARLVFSDDEQIQARGLELASKCLQMQGDRNKTEITVDVADQLRDAINRIDGLD